MNQNDIKKDVLNTLTNIVGKRYVLTNEAATRAYRKGFRFGEGKVLAVVQPANLLQQWNLLKACHAANIIVIMQAANTGLTGGSTPDGDDYDREIVILNTLRMNTIQVIKQGQQVICLPGATLDRLEKTLAPLGREPHSVIGSSCIGASVIGGVCNNSGGALVHRGPAYTEMSIFACVNAAGELQLVNHLGIQLGNTPEEILAKLEQGVYSEADILMDAGAGSDHHYVEQVRKIDADTPARFNADPQRLHEAAGCAGKLIIFAVRLDTFPIEKNTTVFYVGTNDPTEFSAIRSHILRDFTHLPIAGEYLHRDAFDVAEKYGKDAFLLINILGTKKLPALFKLQSRFNALFDRLKIFPNNMSDRIMQACSKLFPNHLPSRMKEYRNRFEHYLMLRISAAGLHEARDFLKNYFAQASGDYFECNSAEGEKAFLHRFVTAGAAVRMRAVCGKKFGGLVALDIALKRNEKAWVEKLPPEIEQALAKKIYYAHFFCHVFHQDYLLKPGYDPIEIEHKMWHVLDQRGAEYPAEHNVGHLYHAKPNLQHFYRELDPHNCFNPGIGQTSKLKNWT